MLKEKLYGVGVGPGNPELITIKAANLLRQADVVFSLSAANECGGIAEEIITTYVNKEAEIVRNVFPMKDDVPWESAHQKTADKIEEYLSQWKKTVFITLGDPLFYSSYCYVAKLLKEKGCDTEAVPGVYSISAVAAKLDLPIGLKNDKVAIVTDFESDEEMSSILKSFQTVIFMKPSKYFDKLKKFLSGADLLTSCEMVFNCGREEEKVIGDISSVTKKDIPYLSTMILINKRRAND